MNFEDEAGEPGGGRKEKEKRKTGQQDWTSFNCNLPRNRHTAVCPMSHWFAKQSKKGMVLYTVKLTQNQQYPPVIFIRNKPKHEVESKLARDWQWFVHSTLN